MKKTYVVKSLDNSMRLDRWLRSNVENIPQGFLEKCLRNGKIKLNKKKVKSSYKVKTNDKIDLFNLDLKKDKLNHKNKINPTNQVIKETEGSIIENNKDFIVVNKKQGISVQGGTKSRKNLIDIFVKSKIFENEKPYTVHRLDKETSGVFIIAKNRATAQLLTSLFRLRKVHKTYLAICEGELIKNQGEWNNNLTRYENNKNITEKARTIYKVLDKNFMSSLVEMKPITGRKHQLRKQLFMLGNPVYGDDKYNLNFNKKKFYKNLMLHSYQIKFMINDKKHTYTASLPDYFIKFMKKKRLKISNYL